MYFTYIIYSKTLDKHYIGSTCNIEKRLNDHNLGLSKFTRRGMPWKLVHTEPFQTRSEAMEREKLIKSYKGGRAFKRLFDN